MVAPLTVLVVEGRRSGMGKDVPATAQCPLGVPAQPCLTGNIRSGAAHLQNPRHPPERLGTSWGDGRSRAVRPRQLWRSFRFSAPHWVQGAALLLLMPGPLGPTALHPTHGHSTLHKQKSCFSPTTGSCLAAEASSRGSG